MLRRIPLLFLVVSAFLLVGCGKTEPTANAPANDNKAATATTPASTSTTTASTTGEKIGVPECDEFITAYEACVVGKVPEAGRAQYKTGIEQWRSSWRKLAANPATKATLVAVCKQSAEQARASMKAYGCTF